MIRSNLLTLLMALGFTSLSLPAYAAPSDPSTYFYPAQEWSISSEPVNIAGLVLRECKMETAFNNGFTIQLIGTHKGVKRMDVDFFQNIFETGKHYDVSVSVPGKSTTAFAGKAPSTHLISLNFDGQSAVYNAVKASSVFDLEIEGNLFRFYMVGFANKAKDFDECMAGDTIKKTPGPADIVATVASMSAPKVEENIILNEAIAYEESERTGVPITEILPEDHPAKITLPVETSENPGVLKSEVHSAVSKPFAQVQPTQHKRLSEQLATQLEDNPQLATIKDTPPKTEQKTLAIPPGLKTRDDVTPMPAPFDGEESTPVQPVEVAVAPVAEGNTTVDVDEAPAVAVASTASTKEFLDKAAESIVAVDGVDPTPEVIMIKPETPQVTITKETEKLEADFTKKAPSDDVSFKSDPALMRKISELQESLQKLEKENKALNDELQSALEESREERTSISSENWNLEKAARRYNEAERQLKKMGQQLQQERTACSAEKQELEMMLFDPKLTEDAQIARLNALQKELDEAKRMIRALEAAAAK